MEKKRRARINESLQELRILLSDVEVSYFSVGYTTSISGQGYLAFNGTGYIASSVGCKPLLFTLFSTFSLLGTIKNGERRGFRDDG